jgi:putative exporter of polyketide antibiotics
MYTYLAIFAAILGLLLTSAAIYTIWTLTQQRKNQQGELTFSQLAGRYFLRWSFFDYTVLVMFLCGMLFLLTEVIAVVREPASFPYHHYGYLLCGFIFSLLGMLFTLARFIIVLRVVRGMDGVSLVNDHQEPNETNAAK